MHSPRVLGRRIASTSASGPVNMLKLVRRRADTAVLLAPRDGPAARSAVAARDEAVAWRVWPVGVAASWVAVEAVLDLTEGTLEGGQLGSSNSDL